MHVGGGHWDFEGRGGYEIMRSKSNLIAAEPPKPPTVDHLTPEAVDIRARVCRAAREYNWLVYLEKHPETAVELVEYVPMQDRVLRLLQEVA